MNGYPYQARGGMTEDRQPPSIPPLSQLAFNRPGADASPSPSHLPPLANHAYGPSSYNSSNLARPSDKTATLAQIAAGQPNQPSYPVQYPPPNAYPPTSGAPGPGVNGPYYNTSQPPPYGEPSHQPNLLPPFNPQAQQGQPQPPASAERPLPVVGSQGRRGILPSAPGRASATAALVAKEGLQPVNRRADGKYECQFCNKSYLHLKHLKRHHLRHTGERPYQCYLCQETFCRSDILKRHFQKCSLRRGNPTGVTHLTHAQAHLRRGNQQTPPQPAGPNGAAPPPASFRPNWPANAHEQNGESNRSSRSSSVVQRPGSSTDERKATNPQTANTSLDTSPQSNNDERKHQQYYREPTGPYDHAQPPATQPGQPQGQYPYYPPQYNSTSQAEFSSSFNSYPNGYRYPPNGEQPTSFPEQNFNPFTQYFQPGSHDPVLSYHQQ